MCKYILKYSHSSGIHCTFKWVGHNQNMKRRVIGLIEGELLIPGAGFFFVSRFNHDCLCSLISFSQAFVPYAFVVDMGLPA